LEAYVGIGRWPLCPLLREPLQTDAGAPTRANEEIRRHLTLIHQATAGQGTWVLDRGFARGHLFGPLVHKQVALVARRVGHRHVPSADGRTLLLSARAEPLRPRRWPRGARRGHTARARLRWPQVSDQELLVVVHRRRWGREPWLRLVSPQARRPGRRAQGLVKA
jgi:hypothetical protein